MKCATARLALPSNVSAAATLALFMAFGTSARSAAAQELQPLPPPAPGPAMPPVAPPLPPAPAPPPPQASEVRFEPDEADVALFRLSAGLPVGGVGPRAYQQSWYPLYDPICEGPCTTNLAPGAYKLALSKGGRVVPVRGPVFLDGPATLRAEYVDRSALRTAGLIIGVGGAVAGFVMVVASAQNGAVCDINGICISTGTTNTTLLVTGVSVLVASAVVGSILTFQGDSARVTVEPLAPAGHASREEGLMAHYATPQGAVVALHF